MNPFFVARMYLISYNEKYEKQEIEKRFIGYRLFPFGNSHLF